MSKKGMHNKKQILTNDGIGFEWDVSPNYFNKNNSESEDSDKDEDNEPKKKKIRKLNNSQRREEQRQEELRLRKIEEELTHIETNPQNADHFDRLVLSNPNSSFIWIKYMACHLQATEVEKARAIAKRALSVIDSREEQEKLNIWTALLNLENLYGTKESFKQTMDEALRSNDEYQIYTKILDIFAESNKLKELEELITKINRKFRDSLDAYLHCATVYFKLNKAGKARFILQKALSNLPTKSHVTMISRFALVENSHGSPEEAQTLFEHVLTSYPSRIDVWSIYVDMLIKSNRIDLARHALERATIQKLAPKKMKSLFNKWMMLEGKHGTSESVDKVKECMNNYVDLILKKLKAHLLWKFTKMSSIPFIDIGANLTDPMFKGIYNGKKKHKEDLEDVLERAWKNDLKKIIITSGSLNDSIEALKIASLSENLYCTVGCHPTRCDEFTNVKNPEAYLNSLIDLIKNNRSKIVAIGECGLDNQRLHFCSKEIQEKYFEMQLKLSGDFNLPLFLHCRDAAPTFLEILKRNPNLIKSGGVVHSFDGSLKEAKDIINLGFYIGINGCSLRTDDNLKTVSELPINRLMLETDCPWCEVKQTHPSYSYVQTKFNSVKKEKFIDGSMVKGRNEPSTIRQVFEVLVSLKKEDPVSLGNQIYQNTMDLFFKDK